MSERFAGTGITLIRGERRVLHDLCFALSGGGALLLQGPNGSGKSSLLRLMAGLAAPDLGRLCWNEEAIDDSHPRRCRLLGHGDAIKPRETVGEALSFWAAFHGAGPDGIAPALAAFALTALADTPGRYLSAGQKRRLALARLIAAPAPLWLLDEPTVGLDAASRAALEGEIARHRAGGGMVVIATHEAVGVADPALLELMA